MPRLNQVLAIEKGVRARTDAEINAAYHAIQKAQLLSGIARDYQPKDQDGDVLPSESTKVQQSAEKLFAHVVDEWSNLLNVVATKDYGNTGVRADVIINDHVLLAEVPVTYLLWLERQLVDVHTFVKKLPVLDPADDWHQDEPGIYRTPPVQTTRTKKVPRNHVKAFPTKELPNITPQVETYFEDVLVGYWKTVKYSGAVPADRKAELLSRVEQLQQAVKYAREQANSTAVDRQEVASALVAFLTA